MARTDLPSLKAPVLFVSITDPSKRVGITPRALRHYQDRGLIRSHRLARNTRVYDLETVEVVETIVALRDVGLSIGAIGEILALRSEPSAQAKVARAALKAARAEDERRIARIDAMLAALDEPSSVSAELRAPPSAPSRRLSPGQASTEIRAR